MDHIFKIGDNAFVSFRRFAPPLSAAVWRKFSSGKALNGLDYSLCFRRAGPVKKGLVYCAIYD
jgi:hypothetical protein